jgi:hypothetical protein
MKLAQTKKMKLVMLPQIQLGVTFLSEIEILSCTHHLKGYKIFRDFGIQGFPIICLEVGLKSKFVQTVQSVLN